MQDQMNANPARQGRVPWNKGKLTGAKPPLRPKHVWSIRTKLRVTVRQKKNGRPVRFELSEQTRQAIDDYLKAADTCCDARKNKREGCACLKPLQTLTAGIPFGRPYSAPFSVR